MQELGLVPPYTHDLEDLLDLLLPHDATLSTIRRGLDRLTTYAVELRYPGLYASSRQAKSAFQLMDRIRGEIRHRLGIRPHRRKKP